MLGVLDWEHLLLYFLFQTRQLDLRFLPPRHVRSTWLGTSSTLFFISD